MEQQSSVCLTHPCGPSQTCGCPGWQQTDPAALGTAEFLALNTAFDIEKYK